MAAVGAALDTAAGLIGSNRDYSRQRYAVITAHPDLRERELIKMASLASALRDGLRERGVVDPVAGFAAEAGVVVFRLGFERWVTETYEQTLAAIMRESLDQLRTVTAVAG